LNAAYEAFKAQHLPTLSPEHARSRQRIFERRFLPKLGDKVLSEISRADIKEIVDKIARKHKAAACNTHRAFSAFLSWCTDHGLLESHALRGCKLPAQYRPRERVLTNDELIAVWKACEDVPKVWRIYFRMLIVTGQRRTEVARMHWEEVDLERKTWTIPAHRTKNRRHHVVPLSPLAVSLLLGLSGRSGFVFPSASNNENPIRSFGPATNDLRSRAKVSGIRLHDLRRTAASIMGEIEVAPHVIEAVLNHKSGIISGIAAIYMRGPDGNALRYPDFVPALDASALRQIGARYIADVRKLAPTGERVTDKMPSNYYFAGLIRLALPNAKIIHSIRNPVDTCISCFSKLFSAEQNHTYDLAELGRYYKRYEQLMAHWRRVLPAKSILDIRYEDVVADLEKQARRIIDYCGLPWDDRCLSFHETERPVRTASATQVRQPIYKSAIGRWRVYEGQLDPLLRALGTAESVEA
jgi:integrase